MKCLCGATAEQEIKALDHDLTQVDSKENSDGKIVRLSNCSVGGEKVISIAMKQISGGFKTVAVEGETEKWTIGADANLSAADTYKLSNSDCVAIKFVINTTAAITGAKLEIGGKYSNNNERHFYKESDETGDAFRYYTKVNNGDFVGVAYTGLMSSIFGDGSKVCYMPLGTFDLAEGENVIYVRQSSLGYRVTLDGDFRVLYKGDAALAEVHVHSYNKSITTPATCTTDGLATFTCSCGDSYTEVIKAGHTWVKGTTVNGDGNATPKTVSYTPYTCSGCTKVKIEINSLDENKVFNPNVGNGAGDVSSNKSGTPEGYLKLNKNKDSVTYTFNYTGTAGTAKLYQRGFMDGWDSSTNQGKKYSSSGGGDNSCNFQVNYGEGNTLINMDETKDIAYSTLIPANLAEGVEGPGGKSNSPVADCLIGEMEVVNGINTFTYKRNGSYNLSVSTFILIIG